MESQNRARDKIKYPILDQFGDIAAKMRTPKGLKERSPEDQREIRWF
jgi:hypothetical protein